MCFNFASSFVDIYPSCDSNRAFSYRYDDAHTFFRRISKGYRWGYLGVPQRALEGTSTGIVLTPNCSNMQHVAIARIEGVFYHQGTPVVEKSFNPTWVGAPQFCIYIYLDGQPSAVI